MRGEIKMEDIQKYKVHPRILELRVILIFRNLINEYGLNKATELFKMLCTLMTVDWQKMNGLVNNVFKIRRLEKTNKERFRQEVVFMGNLYGESKYFIAENYLNVNVDTLYRKSNNLKLEDFLDDDWLNELDSNVTICGIPQYALEAQRFIEAFTIFARTIGNVSTSKAKL